MEVTAEMAEITELTREYVEGLEKIVEDVFKEIADLERALEKSSITTEKLFEENNAKIAAVAKKTPSIDSEEGSIINSLIKDLDAAEKQLKKASVTAEKQAKEIAALKKEIEGLKQEKTVHQPQIVQTTNVVKAPSIVQTTNVTAEKAESEKTLKGTISKGKNGDSQLIEVSAKKLFGNVYKVKRITERKVSNKKMVKRALAKDNGIARALRGQIKEMEDIGVKLKYADKADMLNDLLDKENPYRIKPTAGSLPYQSFANLREDSEKDQQSAESLPYQSFGNVQAGIKKEQQYDMVRIFGPIAQLKNVSLEKEPSRESVGRAVLNFAGNAVRKIGDAVEINGVKLSEIGGYRRSIRSQKAAMKSDKDLAAYVQEKQAGTKLKGWKKAEQTDIVMDNYYDEKKAGTQQKAH